MVRSYCAQGLSLDRCFEITGMTKNQFYYKQSGKKRGRRPSTNTHYKAKSSKDAELIDTTTVVKRIVDVKLDPDHANYFINHKKVYRLMYEHLLLEDKKK